MKKFLLLSTSAFALCAYPALAADTVKTETPAPAKAESPSKGLERHKMGMLQTADANGDGVISKEEFLAQSETTFNEIDANKDGKITKEEMESRREEWRKKMKEMNEERRKMKEKQKAEKSKAPATPEAAPATKTPANKPATEETPTAE